MQLYLQHPHLSAVTICSLGDVDECLQEKSTWKSALSHNQTFTYIYYFLILF